MKPIFEIEREMLRRKLKMELPTDIWREGQALYLNADSKTLLIKYDVINREHLVITKNLIKKTLANFENKSWQQEIKENDERLNALEYESMEAVRDIVKKYPNHEHRLANSTGKDSLVKDHIVLKVFKNENITNYTIDFMNSTNETPDTYRYAKYVLPTDKTAMHHPAKGMLKWIEENKDYYIPTSVSRICCSNYKEGRIKEVLDKNKDYLIWLGQRKHESNKRCDYEFDLNATMDRLYEETKLDKYKLNVPRNWKRYLPIVEWTDIDVWLYILREGLEFNKQYRLGFNRVG